MGKFGFEVAIAKAEESNSSTTRPQFDYFKAEGTPKRIRFITVDGMNKSVLTYSEHYVKFNNGWSRSYSCPDAENDEGPSSCLLCKTKKGSEVEENNYSLKFIMQIVERDAPVLNEKRIATGKIADKVKVWKFSPFLMTSLKPFIQLYGDIGDRDYDIALIDNPDTTSKMKKIYVIEPVSRKAKELDTETEELIATKPALLTVEPAYDEVDINKMLAMKKQSGKPEVKEEVKKNLKSFLADDEDDEEVSVPKEESKVKVAETTDDDDDDDDFFANLKANKK